MKQKTSWLSGFAADSICTVLLTTALSLVMLDMLGHRVGYGQCLLLAFAALLIIILFTRRWWLLPSFILLISLALTAMIFIFKLYDVMLAYVKGFYEWCRSAYPITEPYSYNGSIMLVRLGLVLPLAAALFLYFRKLFVFYLQPIGAAGIIYWLWKYNKDMMVTVLVLLLIVLISSLGRYAGSRINRRRLKDEADCVMPGMLQLHALYIGTVIMIFSFIIAPKGNGDWRSQKLVRFVADVRDYYDYRVHGASGSGSFSIADAGYSGPLGGDMELTNDVTLKVITETPVLLTGSIYDTYNGKNWSDSGNKGSFRFYSSLWQGKKRQAYSLDKPLGGKDAYALYRKLAERIEIKITPQASMRALFYSGSVISVETVRNEEINAYFNLKGELYTIKTPWKANSTYVVTTTVYDRSREGFEENMLALEDIAYRKNDKDYKDICGNYLQLPESLPESVYNTASEITEGITSPYLKAVAIENWLSDNFVYTLTPGEVPEGDDFVEYFLKTGKGYCEYYASAMTVLARCAGIPARYVTGYGIKKNYANSKDYYTATKATAHAWSEIYLEGIGWLTFDASKWVFNEPVTLDEPEETKAPVIEPPVIPTPLPEPTPPQLELPEGSQLAYKKDGVTLLAILIFAIALFVIYLTVRFLIGFVGASNYYRRLCRRYKNREDRLNAAYRRIIKQASFLGVDMEDGDTISTFAARVDEKTGDGLMTCVTAPVIKHRFALQDIRNDDVRTITDHYAAVEKKLKKDMGLFKYIWRRFIVGR
jgi:transglutaminase-like putative cysteine protease